MRADQLQQVGYNLSRKQRGELEGFGVRPVGDPRLGVVVARLQIAPRLLFKVNASVTSDDNIFRD